MPNGYIFLGSENEDFNYRFTLDHFELSPKEKIESYDIQKDYDRLVDIISRDEKETIDEDYKGWRKIYDSNGEYSKELTWRFFHCLLCKKIHINNSFRYCWPCEFCVQRLIKEQQQKSNT